MQENRMERRSEKKNGNSLQKERGRQRQRIPIILLDYRWHNKEYTCRIVLAMSITQKEVCTFKAQNIVTLKFIFRTHINLEGK